MSYGDYGAYGRDCVLQTESQIGLGFWNWFLIRSIEVVSEIKKLRLRGAEELVVGYIHLCLKATLVDRLLDEGFYRPLRAVHVLFGLFAVTVSQDD